MTSMADKYEENRGSHTNGNDKADLMQAAQDAVERGWSIVPALRNKRPAIGWRPYQTERMPLRELEGHIQRDTVTILGVVTGQLSGLFILDADDDNAKEFCTSLGLQPHANTQGGGHHYYFRYPEGRVIKTFAAPGEGEDDKKGYRERFGQLDVRGEGGYANFAGQGEKGSYQIVRDPTDLYDIAFLPESLLEFIEKRPRTEGKSPREFTLTVNPPTVEDLLQRAQTKVNGGRDQACFWLATQLRDNGHSQEGAEAAMQQFHMTLPDRDTKGNLDPFPLEAALQKVERAYVAEAREPWGYGPRFALTDMGNGERLAEAAKDELRFTEIGGWLRWDGRRWERAGEVPVEQTAKRVAKAMMQEAADLYEQAKQMEDKDAAQAAEATAKRFTAHAMKTQNMAKIRSMIKSARSESGLFARQEDFDKSPHLINVLNGTLDLETGQLKTHDRGDKLTRLVSINYVPTEECPNWLAFLDTITAGDKDLMTYLQRVAGYMLTGSTREQVIFVLYGEGQNGKSTFMNVLERLAGEYAASVDSKSLLTKRGSGSSANNDVARLQGVRLAYASEPDIGGRGFRVMTRCSGG